MPAKPWWRTMAPALAPVLRWRQRGIFPRSPRSLTDFRDPTHRRLLVLVAALAAVVLVLTAERDIYDTNFYLLGEATALLAGDHPYRDFFEWGAPLAAYVSAGAQLLVGYRLIGEYLIHWLFMIAGVVVSFHLGLRLSRSVTAWLVMLALAMVILARTPTYHYPKLFFFPVTIWLAWRYMDRPSVPRGAAFGFTTAIAFLFRHDYGVSLGFASVLALALARVAVPSSRRLPSIARDVAAYAVAAAVVVAPWAAVVQQNEGLVDYVHVRATEYENPGVVYASLLKLNPAMALASWFQPDAIAAANSSLWLQQVTVVIPFLLLMSAGLEIRRSRYPFDAVPLDALRLLFAGIFLVFVDAFLIRAPTYFAIVAPVTAALSARYLVAKTALRRSCAIGILLISSVAALAWARESIFRPLYRPTLSAFAQLLASPPVLAATPRAGNGGLMLRYLHDCTAPGDRLLVTGSTPLQVHYYARRSIAGGHLFWHQGWRSDPVHEQQSLALLQRQSVPFAYSTTDPVLDEFRSYPRIHEYLVRNYVELEGSRGKLLVDTRRQPTGQFGPKGFPCFSIARQAPP